MKARKFEIHHEETGQTMVSDASLLTQLQAGDDASFEALFLRHYDRVYHILYRLLGNQADAEDVAQQVFLKLYHSPRRIRSQGDQVNVGGWLYRVAVNTGYNILRSQRRRRDWYARLGPRDTSSAGPAEMAESAELQARVRQILAEMKPRDAKLLLLRHSGLSYKELAAALNLSPSSIGSLLTRAERAFARRYRLAYPEKE
jgi:RNA polymerase sigma-70 factor (ECF subfamily)